MMHRNTATLLLTNALMTTKTKRSELPFASKQKIIQFIVKPPFNKDFKAYCDENEGALGAEGTTFRRRVSQFLSDTKRRSGDPGKFRDLLKKYQLDSEGNCLHCDSSTSDEDEDTTASTDEETFAPPTASDRPTSTKTNMSSPPFNRKGSGLGSPPGHFYESGCEDDSSNLIYSDLDSLVLPPGRK